MTSKLISEYFVLFSISANKPGYGARGAGCGPKGYLTDGGDEWRFVKELNSPYYLIYNRKQNSSSVRRQMKPSSNFF